MKDFIIKVEGMKCEGCEKRIENILINMPTVERVLADHNTGTVTITAEKIDEQIIREKLDDLGFKVLN